MRSISRPVTTWYVAVAVAAVLAGGAGTRASAQEVLTLAEAMGLARTATPMARALAAGTREADARVTHARAGFLPRVDVLQSLERGNQPVFVFGSLLAQRRFSEANFDVGALNAPPATSHVRTSLTVGQQIFDGGQSYHRLRGAVLDREQAGLEQARGGQDAALAAAEAFVTVLHFEAAVQSADAAVAAATSDATRARARRDAGLVTDADVLAVEVHLAGMQERRIAAIGDLTVARVVLNEAIGRPLDDPVALARPERRDAPSDPAALTAEALASRADRQQADLQVTRAENDRRAARAAFLPSVGVQAAWEFNGNSWVDQRSAWLVGAQLRLNIFNGFADRARLAEARQAGLRAAAERDRVAARIAADVRRALARLETAQARETAGEAAVRQATESHRIVRDRYDAGLATITDVLRAGEAVTGADARATAAAMDVILADVALDHALGRLHAGREPGR